MVKQINLLPQDLRPQPAVRWRFVLTTAVILCLVGAALAYLLLLSTRVSVLKNQLAVVEQQIDRLEHSKAQEAELGRLKKALESVSTEYSQGRPLESVILELIEDSLPASCWLQSIHLSNGTLVLDGQAGSLVDIANLAIRLESLPVFDSVTVGTIAELDTSLYSFHVSCELTWNRGSNDETK